MNARATYDLAFREWVLTYEDCGKTIIQYLSKQQLREVLKINPLIIYR